jgi:PKD repeat protein
MRDGLLMKQLNCILAISAIALAALLGGCDTEGLVARFTATPTSGLAPLVVIFNASDSSGDIETYSWDFKDGSSDMGEGVTHTFMAPGDYEVTLTVIDSDNTMDSAKKIINVTSAGNQPPTATFTATPVSGDAPLDVSFDATGSTDSDGRIDTYEWDFGDGSTGTGVTVSHSYTDAGTYPVNLTVTDDDNATDSTSEDIVVTSAGNQLPNASFTATPVSGDAPLDVSFDATGSTDSDGTIDTYEWDFGDGSTGTGDTINHTYTTQGTYTVTLTVTDDAGGSDTATTSIEVTSGNPDPFGNVSELVGDDRAPAMASGYVQDGDEEVFLVWSNNNNGTSEIYFNKTSQNGTNWSVPQNISNNTGPSSFPDVDVYWGGTADPGNKIVAVWDDSTSGNREILFSRSLDGGENFETPINISNTATGASAEPEVAILSGDRIIVTWQEDTFGLNNFEIYYALSTDGGLSFGTPINISDNATNSSLPVIASSGSEVVLAWLDETVIYVARSLDAGENFLDPIAIPNGGFVGYPTVSFVNMDVLVAWQGGADIFIAHSIDGGNSFGDPPINISNNGGAASPPIVAYGEISQTEELFLVAWEDSVTEEIVMSYSRNLGMGFEAPVNISGENGGTGGSAGSYPPAAAVSAGGWVYVAWTDNSLFTGVDIVVATKATNELP